MGKGQSGLLLLIIIGIVVIVLFVAPQIFNSSTPVEPVRYRNDIITLENFEVSNLRPVKGSIITVSFDVTNNGDKSVDDVVIDLSGSTLATKDSIDIIECQLGEINVKKKACLFKKIDSLDSRKVTVNFRASDTGPKNILVKVGYPYSGTREALIPIIDDKTIKRPPAQFRMSQPSFGPFSVEIIPPTKGWAISDQPFEMKFKLRYTGSTAAGVPTEGLNSLKIDEKRFLIDLSKELKVMEKDKGGYLSCQFEPGVSPDDKDSYPMINKRGIEVNKEYTCNLQATVKPGELFGYKAGTISVKFFYDFEFQRIQSINVVGVA